MVRVNKLSDDEKKAIKNWIKDNRTTDELWGENNNSDQSSVTHSIFALLTLLLLGDNPKEIKEEFKKQIRLIFKSIVTNNTYFYYEEYSIPTDDADMSGKKFKRIRINHFVLPFAIELFLKIGCFAQARILIKRLIKINYDGAWGLYQTFRTTWATQQAIDAIIEYQKSKKSCFTAIYSFSLLIWYKYWHIIAITLLLFFVFILVLGSDNAIYWCITLVVGVIAGTLANKITD